MHYEWLICAVAMLAAILTFFSGFGLGTILLPVFSLFFPVNLAIGMTAIVHLCNNIFKFVILKKHIDWSIVKSFGIPSTIAAILGAFLLSKIGDLESVFTYRYNHKIYEVIPVKLTIGLVLILFALYEIIPSINKKQFDKKFLSIGGLLSGFFGGLSGHQGALRSAFLGKLGLAKESFIATGVMIACLIDVSRIGVYANLFDRRALENNVWLMISAILFSFLGSIIGNAFLKKLTIALVQKFVAIALIIFGFLLSSGIV
jgi:hypothetical protein